MKKLDATLVDNLTIEYFTQMQPLTVKKKFNLKLAITNEALTDPMIAYKAATVAAMSLGYKAVIVISATHTCLNIKMSLINRSPLKGLCAFSDPILKVKCKGGHRVVDPDELKPKVKLLHGVGVNDYDGITHANGDTNKKLKFYTAWVDMIKRCYSDKWRGDNEMQSSTMCDEWHSLSAFKAWFDDNYKESWWFSKSIIIQGGKHYSPDTCAYVPADLVRSAITPVRVDGMLSGVRQQAASKKYHSLFWMGRDSQLYKSQKGAQIDFFKHRSMKLTRLLKLHHNNLPQPVIDSINTLRMEKYNG